MLRLEDDQTFFTINTAQSPPTWSWLDQARFSTVGRSLESTAPLAVQGPLETTVQATEWSRRSLITILKTKNEAENGSVRDNAVCVQMIITIIIIHCREVRRNYVPDGYALHIQPHSHAPCIWSAFDRMEQSAEAAYG